ncbi:MAG: MBL fold metallo-hydrolase [Acidimicrobiales bacterium]|nr:MBL fold metallo-hydrolase [Acidimicrobiales bacterium]
MTSPPLAPGAGATGREWPDRLAGVGKARRWWRTRGHDLDAQAELARRPLPLPAGLEIEWLGTAGYHLRYQGASLVVDPYFTRASLGDVARRRPLVADPTMVDRMLGADADVVAVAVGHTHFDHAVDVPAVVGRHGCPAYGSSSLAHLLGLHGMSGRAVTVEPHRRYEAGPFTLRFVPSAHSKLLAGLAVPADGELTCDHVDGLSGAAYRCGQVFGIHITVADTTIYHQGSAAFVEDELTTGPVDVFLAGIAGRAWSPGYVGDIVRILRPSVVVPGHYDDFFRPLDDEMGFSFNVNLAAFVDEVGALSPDLEIAALAPRRPA